jgi:Family of unknown function (DUF6186)
MRTLTIAGFVTLAAVAVALYATGQRRRVGLVPLADVLDALRARPLVRIAVAVIWVWVGWHLLAR